MTNIPDNLKRVHFVDESPGIVDFYVTGISGDKPRAGKKKPPAVMFTVKYKIGAKEAHHSLLPLHEARRMRDHLSLIIGLLDNE